VDTEAYNQELSERRAQAVADRFADLADLDRYVVDVAGRGESEPRVSGTGDTERALNRRVEVVFTPDGQAGRQEAPEQAGGASAVSDGPTAAGPEGVVLDLDGAQVRVRLAEVERRADLLVGQVEITHVSGDVGSVGPRLAAQGAMSYRGSFDPGLQYAPTNLTLRSGGQWFFPLDYVRPADASVRPLTELNMSPALPGGGTYVATVVWPDVTRGETGLVTVDVHNPREEEAYRSLRPPFRLTDVPVRAAMKAW
ncbi:MAG: OmpA family protein, partial [Cellulomonadaceae bacterium]